MRHQAEHDAANTYPPGGVRYAAFRAGWEARERHEVPMYSLGSRQQEVAWWGGFAGAHEVMGGDEELTRVGMTFPKDWPGWGHARTIAGTDETGGTP